MTADFTFVIKATRRITHMSRLKNVGETLDFLYKTTGTLGSRLGPLLFQLPPYLRVDLERLTDFLDLLPDGTRAAIEFRHDSWKDDEAYEALRARGMPFVCADTEEGEEDEPKLGPDTAPSALM